MTRLLKLTALAALLCLFTACSKPPLLMPGLELPPGSAVVLQTLEEGDAARHIGEKVAAALTVEFDNPGGWAVVRGHFDALMAGRGFYERVDRLAAQMAQEDMTALKDAKSGNVMRSYGHDDDRYSVTLFNTKGSSGTDPPLAGGGERDGEFVLVVVRYK
jgi:hypothetical protein